MLLPTGTEILPIAPKGTAFRIARRAAQGGRVPTVREPGSDRSPSDLRSTGALTRQGPRSLGLAWRGVTPIIMRLFGGDTGNGSDSSVRAEPREPFPIPREEGSGIRHLEFGI